MRIAIYEPSPRICGPDTWAQHLKIGFEELGHACQIVSFTNNGKAPPRWGRVERAKSSSMSCAMQVNRVNKFDDAGEVLDEYDLIVLTDVKTPMHDNAALDDPMLDEPQYISVLKQTKTPWTSALHGRWYFAHPDPIPQGLSERSGSPFIHDLLALPNFSDFLISHARDFARYCPALQAVEKELSPLPFRPRELPVNTPRDDRFAKSLAVIGRMIPTKHRHFVNEILTRGHLPGWVAHYGGACSCTHGPSETYIMTEQLTERGWTTNWGDDGVRKTKPFTANNGANRCVIIYHGAYTDPREVLTRARCHVGITDCDFSGGLFEFATLEAIESGCFPVITTPFVPHGGTNVSYCEIKHEFRKFTPKSARECSDSLCVHAANAIEQAAFNAGDFKALADNWHAIRSENDPKKIAQLFIDGAL
jgi:hypothetical protein